MIAEGMPQEARLESIRLFMGFCEKASEADAVFFLELHGYDVEKAVVSYFEHPNGVSLRLMRKNSMMTKYAKYLQDKGGLPNKKRSLFECLNRTARRLRQQVRLIWKEVVPSSLRGRFPGELFYEQYGVSLHWVHLEDASLEDCFRRCYETGRPLVVYEFNKDFIQNVLTVFTIQTSQLLNWQFLTVGIGSHDTQARDFLRKQCGVVDQSNASSISVFRVDNCEDLTLISHLLITEAVTAVQVFNFFQETLAFVTEEKALEAEAAREVEMGFKGVSGLEPPSQGIHVLHSPPSNLSDANESGLMEQEPEFEHHHDWFSEKELKSMQEEEFKKSELEHERRKQIELQARIIQEREEKDLQDKISQRRARKMSLPKEPDPVETPNIITLGFRLPRGGRILRRFSKSSLVQDIFDYIELNEEVEFENERDRHFDLLTILNGFSLASKKDSLIGNVFGDQHQETLLVKQL